MPMKFSSPASTPFALTGSPVFSPGNSIFGSVLLLRQTQVLPCLA
jgi:hypothetical protein